MVEFDLKQLQAEYKKGFQTWELDSVRPAMEFLRKDVSPWLSRNIKLATKSSESLKTRLVTSRSSLGSVSRPTLCANHIYEEAATGVYLQAQKALNEEDRGRFLVWYDLAEGVQDAVACIFRAEGVFVRGAKEEVVYALDIKGMSQKALEEAAERFQRYNQMLIQDPTGIALVEYQVSRHLRTLFDFPATGASSYITNDIVFPTNVLARMYAAEVYKIVYPLSE